MTEVVPVNTPKKIQLQVECVPQLAENINRTEQNRWPTGDTFFIGQSQKKKKKKEREKMRVLKVKR